MLKVFSPLIINSISTFSYYCCCYRQKSDGEPSNNGVGNLTSKMNQLKRQIQAERVVSIKVSLKFDRIQGSLVI